MTFGASDPLTLPRNYSAVQATDGTVRVAGVPIFGENIRLSPQGDLNIFSPKWLKRAIQKDQALRADGYTVPLHFGHHEPGIVREPAGHVELESVGLRWYCGEPTWVLFGTLVFKDARRFQKAREQYPYRSVEISHEKSDEINSLALLDTEAPFFRFPNLNFSASNHGGVSQFHWRHQILMSAPTTSYGVTIAPGLPAPPKHSIGGSIQQETVPGPAPVKSAGGDEKAPDIKASADGPPEEKKPEGVAAEAGAAGPAPAAPAAPGLGAPDMEARLMRLEAMVAKLCGAEMAEAGAVGADGPMAGPQKKVPIVSASATAKLEGMFAAQSAQIARLEKQLSERAARDTTLAVREELAAYGLPNLDLEIQTRLKDGSLQGWAAGIKQAGRKVTATGDAAPVESADPPEVAKFSEHGPKVLAEARRCFQVYSASGKKSPARNHGLAAFLASNVKVEE